jgi:hypothetical protein
MLSRYFDRYRCRSRSFHPYYGQIEPGVLVLERIAIALEVETFELLR